MVAPPDWTPYVASGLLPTDEPERTARMDLLLFLLDQGCSLDEMVEADRRGRLFALAGDKVLRPGARALTLGEVAERTGGEVEWVRRLWRALGLLGWDGDDRVASEQDADALQPIVAATPVIGEDLTLELVRAMGAALARFGDAAQAVFRGLSPRGSLATSESELETARYWTGNAFFLPALGRALDTFSRHHHELARSHFERSESWDVMFRRLTRLAVGFVDMTGFTTAAEHMGETEFARLMTTFSARVGEIVHDHGGRVVKFVGDAAMIVTPSAAALATIVSELMESPTTVGGGLSFHAGLAQGELLNLDGDYFGSAVNIAARLSALAGPGTVLCTEPVGRALADAGWSIDWRPPTPVRGITDPVVTGVVHPRGGT
jgi:class 3 adenylate cyclase